MHTIVRMTSVVLMLLPHEVLGFSFAYVPVQRSRLSCAGLCSPPALFCTHQAPHRSHARQRRRAGLTKTTASMGLLLSGMCTCWAHMLLPGKRCSQVL